MTYDELLRAVHEALPDTTDKLAIERVRYCKNENKAYFSFLSDVLIGERGFFTIKNVLGRAFPGLDFSLRVASPSLAQEFMREPDRYAAPLNHYLMRHYPAVASWEFDMRWTPGNGRIILEMPDEFSMRYLEKQNVGAQLAQVIRDVFRLDTEVSLRVCGDEEKRLNALREERQAQDRVAAERAERYDEMMREQEKKKEAQAETPKPADLRIRGRVIGDKPVPIKELRDDSGLVTVRGKVLSVENKEISGGETVLLTFLMTDFTSTIRCKTFLRYRPRRPRDAEGDPPPITDSEREAVQKIVDAVKPNMGITVRGETQYDQYAHETVITVRDMMRCDLPVRMDTAEEKRIELHLHTQMSNMDAVSSTTALI